MAGQYEHTGTGKSESGGDRHEDLTGPGEPDGRGNVLTHIDFTAEGGAYFKVYVDSNEISRHTTQYTAQEVASKHKLLFPDSEVWYEYSSSRIVAKTSVTIFSVPQGTATLVGNAATSGVGSPTVATDAVLTLTGQEASGAAENVGVQAGLDVQVPISNAAIVGGAGDMGVSTSLEFSMSNVVFLDGDGDQTHDLSQYYSSLLQSGEAVSDISLASGSTPLPTGVTIDVDNEQLVFTDSVGTPASASGVVFNVTASSAEADWQARSTASGVFYANNFDYSDRASYLADAHSYVNEGSGGSLGLDVEQTIKLTGQSSSKHSWFLADGANENGPNWRFSFDGVGASTTTTKKTEFYFQYSLYADSEWADFVYSEGAIKTCILFHPGEAPFASGEIVQTRRGEGPWPSGFRVTGAGANTWQLVWDNTAPSGLDGDDTYFTFWDGGAQSEGGETDSTDPDLFERRWGPRRRNMVAADTDYANVPQIEGGKWYTFEVYVNLDSPNSVVKCWFAEYGQEPILLYGLIDSALTENTDTYRGMEMLSRAENAQNDPGTWISQDTFICFDELIVSDSEILFPGGYSLPDPGTDVPSNWPPSGASPRYP